MYFDINMLRGEADKQDRLIRILVLSTQGSAPREGGTSMLVTPDGETGTIGGGALEWQAIETARNLATATTIRTIPLGPGLGQCCGGSVTLLFERFDKGSLPTGNLGYARPIAPDAAPDMPLAIADAIADTRRGQPSGAIQQRGWLWEPFAPRHVPFWLYGAGHVGRAVVRCLDGLPFDITWVDTAENRFPKEISANATPLIASNPADATRHAPQDAHHCVMTFSHALDLEICHAVLSRPHAWLGLIGSKTKAARFRKRLKALGHDPARLTCPIGDPTLGKEPAAIAISLASDLLRRQNEALIEDESRIPA